MFNCDNLSFTTTALSRPDIVEQTYASFSQNIDGLKFKDFKLYINIDPIPDRNRNAEVIEVAREYFNEVITNEPIRPNFPAALNWCWSNADTDFIFHLEDDWLLLQKFNLDHIYNMMTEREELVQAIFRAYVHNYGNNLALSPGVWKKICYKKFAGNFSTEKNPETQLRNGLLLGKDKRAVFMLGGEHVVVKDIGRAWIKRHGYRKITGKKVDFITYEQFK